MKWIDRYTWWRWKESCLDRYSRAEKQLTALGVWCNSSIRNRAVSLACLACVIMGLFFVSKLFRSPPQIAVPQAFVASKIDENGDTWTLDFLKGQNFRDLSNTKAAPGPPLALKADIQRNAEYISIHFYIVGNAGEKYIPVALKNNRWQNPPNMEIRNNQGKVIYLGEGLFGGAGLRPYYWPIPNGFRGQFIVELKTSFGPFSVLREPISFEI